MDYEATEDPQVMDDEEYAEWIRAGMWRYVFADMRYLFDGCYSFPHAHCRKKHAAEFEEQERKKAEREARHAQEEAIRAETRRLAREEEERRKNRRRSKERRREAEMREAYDSRWKDLLASSKDEQRRKLRFKDVPWPVAGHGSSVSMEDLTVDAISAFLLLSEEDATASAEASKIRKEKLRETMLRFHPDKFEARVMSRITEKDKEMVREAVGLVVRTVSDLMAVAK